MSDRSAGVPAEAQRLGAAWRRSFWDRRPLGTWDRGEGDILFRWGRALRRPERCQSAAWQILESACGFGRDRCQDGTHGFGGGAAILFRSPPTPHFPMRLAWVRLRPRPRPRR